MTDRIVITLIVVAAGVAAYLVLQRWQQGKATAAMSAGNRATGRPTVLYFRSDHCAPCAAQGRFLDLLSQQMGEAVSVQKIDADADAETAAKFGVFTVPTTLVVDGRGQVRHTNYGLADLGKLTSQLRHL